MRRSTPFACQLDVVCVQEHANDARHMCGPRNAFIGLSMQELGERHIWTASVYALTDEDRAIFARVSDAAYCAYRQADWRDEDEMRRRVALSRYFMPAWAQELRS